MNSSGIPITADRIKVLSQLVGKEVRTLSGWAGVPVGTIGIVDELYELGGSTGIMVCWCMPGESDYFAMYKALLQDTGRRPTNWTQMVRYGFRGVDELRFLEVLL